MCSTIWHDTKDGGDKFVLYNVLAQINDGITFFPFFLSFFWWGGDGGGGGEKGFLLQKLPVTVLQVLVSCIGAELFPMFSRFFYIFFLKRSVFLLIQCQITSCCSCL